MPKTAVLRAAVFPLFPKNQFAWPKRPPPPPGRRLRDNTYKYFRLPPAGAHFSRFSRSTTSLHTIPVPTQPDSCTVSVTHVSWFRSQVSITGYLTSAVSETLEDHFQHLQAAKSVNTTRRSTSASEIHPPPWLSPRKCWCWRTNQATVPLVTMETILDADAGR